MNNIYTELLQYIKAVDLENILFYRSKEELSYLNEWLSSENSNLIHSSDTRISSCNGPFLESGDNTDSFPDMPDDSLYDLVKKCKKCGSIVDKKHGYGTGKNGIMVILNSPSDISRVERMRLKDGARDLLIKMISAINMDIRDCYVTNLIKCEPDDLLRRPGLMFKNCELILHREINEFKPKVIIVMGDDLPVKRIVNQRKEINWYAINHPLSLLKKSELKKPAWETLKTVISALKD